MSIISDAIQAKCLAFGDRIIKLNDYLLEPSSFSHQPSRVPVHLQAIATFCNQLLRAGASRDIRNYRVSRDTKTHRKSSVSATFCLSPFPGEEKGFGVKVEAFSYGKRRWDELRFST